MEMRTVRDVIGDPEQWSNCVSDEPERMPDVSDATILDVFSNANEIAVHLRAAAGSETLSVFRIHEPADREGLVKALRPGRKLSEALAAPMQVA